MDDVKKKTQADRVLEALLSAKGDWVNGRYFLRELYLSQYHRAIWELEHRDPPVPIIHSEFRDDYGFLSYRIKRDDEERNLFDLVKDAQDIENTMMNQIIDNRKLTVCPPVLGI